VVSSRALSRGIGIGWAIAWAASGCSLVDSVEGYAGSSIAEPDAAAEASADAEPDALVVDSGQSCTDASECNDDNPCTTDACWGATCLFTADPGAPCGDGNPCNGDETCDAQGDCKAGSPPDLDDDNDCTVDFCDPTGGVQHDLVDYPPSKTCNPFACPPSFYRAKSLLCDPACGTDNCGFCINTFQCERACEKKVTACCVNTDQCGSSCPTGYAVVAQTCSNDCGCFSCGPAVVCER
jgi:hypothetical protein